MSRLFPITRLRKPHWRCQLEKVLNEREWLAADRFTAADLLMADVLRVSKVRSFGDRPATDTYVTRVTDRPSFKEGSG